MTKKMASMLAPLIALLSLNTIWHLLGMEETWGWKSILFLALRLLLYFYFGMLCSMQGRQGIFAFVAGSLLAAVETLFGAILFTIEGSGEAAIGLIISGVFFSFLLGVVSVAGFLANKSIISLRKPKNE